MEKMRHVSEEFYDRLPSFARFASLTDPQHYAPVPDDWLIAVTDVVDSSAAIGSGRYKAVNLAGAAAIAAISNALAGRNLPFVFGGDGASCLVGAADEPLVKQALAATVTWAREELGLVLRAAVVPVHAVREAGFEVSLARFGASSHVSYAMIMGGGMAHAEACMRQGRFTVAAAPPGTRPDLHGLSCQWQPFAARNGLILSVILVPRGNEPGGPFRALVDDILALAMTDEGMSRPAPQVDTDFPFVPATPELQDVTSRGGPSWRRRARARLRYLVAFLFMRRWLRTRRFDPATYLAETIVNSDFRKYQDGLKLTLDCGTDLAERIEARLREAAEAGQAVYGLARQDRAIMTCLVPSVAASRHYHFIDGAAGGYAAAAAAMKSRLTGT